MKVGIDLIDIERMENARESFFKKIFTKNEIAYCKSFVKPSEHFAGIFSAKEAIMKALGFGLDTIPFHDIEITHNKNRKPIATLTGIAKEKFEEIKAKEMDISISHTNTLATAICIIK